MTEGISHSSCTQRDLDIEDRAVFQITPDSCRHNGRSATVAPPPSQPAQRVSTAVSATNVAQAAVPEGSATVIEMGHLLGHARVSIADQQPHLQVGALEHAGYHRCSLKPPAARRPPAPPSTRSWISSGPGDTLVVWKPTGWAGLERQNR
jgi:hypothetical protein